MRHPIGLKQGFRTPFVKMDQELSTLNAVELSSHLVEEMLGRLDFPRELIQHVIWGCIRHFLCRKNPRKRVNDRKIMDE